MTKIEWTDVTWNPVTGCNKVSPGCANCYAETVDHRFDHDKVGKRPWAFPAARGGRGVTLHPGRLEQPLHWKKPRKIFVNSMSDLFHEDVPDEFLPRVFGIMAATPWHTYQILTKRPERMLEVVNDSIFYEAVEQSVNWEYGTGPIDLPWPLPNVWLGVSVENQFWAGWRIPLLLQTPAAMRFLSVEPMLGPVDLYGLFNHGCCLNCGDGQGLGRCCSEPFWSEAGIDWVICGGESGPKARPMNPDWPRSLRDQCQESGLPFFFKQWGDWLHESQTEINYPSHVEGLKRFTYKDGFYRLGKKAAGAVLDGKEYREWPNVNRAA